MQHLSFSLLIEVLQHTRPTVVLCWFINVICIFKVGAGFAATPTIWLNVRSRHVWCQSQINLSGGSGSFMFKLCLINELICVIFELCWSSISLMRQLRKFFRTDLHIRVFRRHVRYLNMLCGIRYNDSVRCKDALWAWSYAFHHCRTSLVYSYPGSHGLSAGLRFHEPLISRTLSFLAFYFSAYHIVLRCFGFCVSKRKHAHLLSRKLTHIQSWG